MDDPLHDYVKALLDQDYGDERILKQILRAYENSEVISNSERDYIERMAEKYLGKKRSILPVETPPSQDGSSPGYPNTKHPDIWD